MIEIVEILTLLQIDIIIRQFFPLNLTWNILHNLSIVCFRAYKFFCFTDLNSMKFADYPAENQQRALSRIHREETRWSTAINRPRICISDGAIETRQRTRSCRKNVDRSGKSHPSRFRLIFQDYVIFVICRRLLQQRGKKGGNFSRDTRRRRRRNGLVINWIKNLIDLLICCDRNDLWLYRVFH